MNFVEMLIYGACCELWHRRILYGTPFVSGAVAVASYRIIR